MKISGSLWYLEISPFGMVVMTEKPIPDTAAQIFRRGTLGELRTVMSMEAPKDPRPNR